MRILGISIGGTKTSITFADFDQGCFKNFKKQTFPTIANSDKAEIQKIFDLIDNSNEKFELISIVSGGPLDTKQGIINCPPHLPGFLDTPIVRIFENKYSVDVVLLNDADASALAEYKFGNGGDSNNFAYLTFGTGIGAGLILNGKLYTGNNSMAGEIGHIRLTDNGPVGYGKEGSVEGWCAGGNIPKWAGVKDANNTKEIFEAAYNGNKNACEVVDLIAEKLGESISVLVDLLNPDKVVIGGIYARNIDLLEEKVRKSVDNHSLKFSSQNCEILPSKLGEKIDDFSSLMGLFSINRFANLYENYEELKPLKKDINQSIDMIIDCYKNNGQILVCGNGGSASDSAHIVGELMKSFAFKRKLDPEIRKVLTKEFGTSSIGNQLEAAIPCIDLTAQSSLITAFSNDVDPDLVFAQQVLGYSQNNKNNIVIGLSTSGNSKNVVYALKTAKAIGLKTIGFTGENESELSKIATICLKVPSSETFRIQEYHLPVYHHICKEVERRLFDYEVK